MDSWSGSQSSSASSQTKAVGGKQNSEKVAWFYQPNYTKLAALLLIERQRKSSSPANKNHLHQELSDKDGNSDSDSCSSGKENNCDFANSNSSSSSPSYSNSDAISNNSTPFFPSQGESVSSSVGDDIASERANFIRSRRSQPISRSGSSEAETSSSSLIPGIQQSDLEKELEIVKQREEREEREQRERENGKERETDIKSMDTQMSDLEVAEELLSLVRVSASLPYAPIKNESTDFKPITSIKIDNKKEKENIQIDEKENQVTIINEVHQGHPIIPNSTPTTRQVALASAAANNSATTNTSSSTGSTTGSGGPYRRRTNACLEHKRKHQKCPYDCIYKKRAQSPSGSPSTPNSPPATTTTTTSTPTITTSSLPSTPTLVVAPQSAPVSKVFASTSPSISSPPSPSISTLLPNDTIIPDLTCESTSQTHILTPHKEFSSLVTKFLSFGMNVPSLNTFGSVLPMGESLFPKLS